MYTSVIWYCTKPTANVSAYNIVLVLSGKGAYFFMKYLGTTGQICWFFLPNFIHYYTFEDFKWYFQVIFSMGFANILCLFSNSHGTNWYDGGGGVLISPSTQIRLLIPTT